MLTQIGYVKVIDIVILQIDKLLCYVNAMLTHFGYVNIMLYQQVIDIY